MKLSHFQFIGDLLTIVKILRFRLWKLCYPFLVCATPFLSYNRIKSAAKIRPTKGLLLTHLARELVAFFPYGRTTDERTLDRLKLRFLNKKRRRCAPAQL